MDGGAQGYGAMPDVGWPLALLAASPDLVFALDPATTIIWCNESVRTMLGHDPCDIVGRSFAEFVHADDLVRAAEVIDLAGNGAFDTFPMTPALYRVRSGDGEWVQVDVNASTVADGSMLVVVRPGGDLVVVDRLLEAISEGRPFEEQADIVMRFGRWRHPDEGYAIHYRDDDGERAVLSAGVPAELLEPGAYGGLAPWEQAELAGAEVVVDPLPAPCASGPFVGCLASPVPDPDHEAGASIVIWTGADGPTTSGHRYALANMTRCLDLILQQRAQVRRLERAAQVDALTGLASRARFLEVLESSGPGAAVLYVDLDGFKAVNDAYGHAVGDATLVAAADRLLAVAPEGATVGRLGGDEFALLHPHAADLAAAQALAGEIVDAFSLDSEGAIGDVRASVGVALGDADQSPTEVLHAADVALLAAKATGRNRWASA